MKLCFNEATALNCSSLEQDLKLCDAVGFDYIEPRIDMLKGWLQSHTVEELADFFQTHHLKPHAVNAIYLSNRMFAEGVGQTEREEKVLDDFRFACRIGKAIGSPAMIVVPDIAPGDRLVPNPEPWDSVVENSVRILKRLSAEAYDYDMKLCFEPVGIAACCVKSMTQAKEIVEAVNEENVGYCPDPSNLYLYRHTADFSEITQVAPEKIFVAHINDMDAGPVGKMMQSDRCFCGRGVINLKDYIGSLMKAGYDGMISIETFRPAYWEMKPEDTIREAYESTRDFLISCGACC